MKTRFVKTLAQTLVLTLALSLIIVPVITGAQDRLKSMPGFDQYQKMNREITDSVKPGVLQATWKDGGKAFEYRKDGKLMRYDVATKQATEATSTTGDNPAQGGMGRRPERGRQFDSAMSPDGKLK